jgi:hypothetical protein
MLRALNKVACGKSRPKAKQMWSVGCGQKEALQLTKQMCRKGGSTAIKSLWVILL